MTTRGATRKKPGPQPDGSFYDPYDDLTDEELDQELAALFESPRNAPSVHTTIRLPAEVVTALRRIGASRGIPYQTLVRRILTDAVSRLERSQTRPKP